MSCFASNVLRYSWWCWSINVLTLAVRNISMLECYIQKFIKHGWLACTTCISWFSFLKRAWLSIAGTCRVSARVSAPIFTICAGMFNTKSPPSLAGHLECSLHLLSFCPFQTLWYSAYVWMQASSNDGNCKRTMSRIIIGCLFLRCSYFHWLSAPIVTGSMAYCWW